MKSKTPAVRGLRITRRAFLRASCGVLAAAPLSYAASENPRPLPAEKIITFGIVTDCHYAAADRSGSRYYRHSVGKLGKCVKLMNAWKPDFLIELGDFKDQNKPAVEAETLDYLRTIEKVYQRFEGPTYHVLGNHDMDSISKRQFLCNVTNTGIDPSKSYYSFDVGKVHFVVLDANFRPDGIDYDRGNFNWKEPYVPQAELDWLEGDLRSTRGPAVVFTHQLLDGRGAVYIENAEQVREILESSHKVVAVFQGHHHAGSYSLVNGIHYYTLKALVEGPAPKNNSFAIADIHPDLSITVTGFKNAESAHLALPDDASVRSGPAGRDRTPVVR